MRPPDLMRRRLRALSGLGCAAAAAGLLAGCGTAASDHTARGAVSAFDSALSARHYAAACALLGPIPQAVLIDADTSARHRPGCAAALASADTQRTLKQFQIPAGNVARTTVSAQGGGVVLLQSDTPLPVTYTLTHQHGRWLITGF